MLDFLAVMYAGRDGFSDKEEHRRLACVWLDKMPRIYTAKVPKNSEATTDWFPASFLFTLSSDKGKKPFHPLFPCRT